MTYFENTLYPVRNYPLPGKEVLHTHSGPLLILFKTTHCPVRVYCGLTPDPSPNGANLYTQMVRHPDL